jgi:hypothetical protein
MLSLAFVELVQKVVAQLFGPLVLVQDYLADWLSGQLD